jgi:hypothetical protein
LGVSKMSQEELVYFEDLHEKQVIARGSHGMTHGRRPRSPRLPFSGPVSDMTIHRQGRAILVPAFFFTREGRLRKSCLAQYYELLGNSPTEQFQICEVCTSEPNECALLP